MSLSSTETKEWFDHVQTYFKEELEKDIDSSVCVFKVPKSLSSAKPEAYTPQLVGLGPYHHLQPQLREMERVKLHAVKKFHGEFNGSSFLKLVEELSKRHLDVRACYHKFLDIETYMLSWIMTVDALFLLHLLCLHAVGKKTLEPYSLCGLADLAGKKLAEDAILRDVMMLENQIPIFFLEKLVLAGCEHLEVAERKTIEENFPNLLVGFCQALSPLEETINNIGPKALKCAHLLDLLYSMVVRREDELKIGIPADVNKIEEHTIEIPESPDGMVPASDIIGRIALQRASVTKDVLKHLQVPNLPFMDKIRPHSVMVQSIMNIISRKIGSSALDSLGHGGAPAEEKGLIPTASSLAKAGVKFHKTKYIEDTSFEEKTRTFHVPAIKLGVNSEVVIRNLVAYEAMAISGPLVLARFLELMDSLLDTPHDVKLLKRHGIITGSLKDDELTRLFRGVSHSIEVRGHCQLDKTIKKVNEFYNAAPSIRTLRLIERYVYGAWKVLATAATVLFFLLMVLQTVCSAYSCSSLVIIDKLPHVSFPHVLSLGYF